MNNSIREQINKFKEVNLLHEGYQEAKEIEKLANEILWKVAKYNWHLVNRVRKHGADVTRFDQPTFMLEGIDIDSGKYDKLKKFIEQFELTIQFTEIDSGFKGRFVEPNFGRGAMIIINKNSNGFNERMKLLHNNWKDADDIDFDTAYYFLGSDLTACFKSTLMHELQHAYDFVQSWGRYRSDDKSKRYFQRQKKRQQAMFNTNEKDKISFEEYEIYLTLPHEYWARFTQAVEDISHPRYKSTWLVLMEMFKWRLEGWHNLGETHKKRLIKAFYKYCTMHDLIAKK